MNVNNQAMPMGDNTGQAGDGQTGPKRHFKHIGELADESKAKVVIMYRTVPGEPNNCLVVGTKFLPDLYHNALMRAVESEGGQEADEFADYAGRQAFQDGTNMLAMLHNDNYIKKFKTNEIVVTYGNTDDGRILLSKLNEMIAKEKGISVKDMAKDPEASKKSTKKADAKTWVQLTQDFVKEWPEVLEGLHFQNMPVKYLLYIDIILKNNITIHYDIAKELRIKKQDAIARFLRKTIEQNYIKIKNVDIKFDIPKLKKDMESKTSTLMAKTFKK